MFEQEKKQFKKLPRGLTLREITQRLGVSYAQAYQWCRKYGYAPRLQWGPHSEAREARREQMKKIPPNLTVREVAKRLKLPVDAAYRWVYDTHYVFRKGYIKVPHERWHEMDWNLRDVDIARILNVSRELVRTIRIKLRKPKSPMHGVSMAPPKGRKGGSSRVAAKAGAKRKAGRR